MAFRPHIPAGMSTEEFDRLCYLDMQLRYPLEIAPPVRKKAFLSPNEIKLLSYLVPWCPNFLVLTQVHLLQMINVDRDDIDADFIKSNAYAFGDDPGRVYWRVFNMVSLLSVDFVLADRLGSPVYAIELNGLEHEQDPEVIERDKVKAHVLDSIGVPLLKIRNAELSSLCAAQQKVQGFAR